MKTLILIVLLFGMTSCQNQTENFETAIAPMDYQVEESNHMEFSTGESSKLLAGNWAPPSPPPQHPSPLKPSNSVKKKDTKKIIKTVSLDVVVQDHNSTRISVEELVKNANGYISNEHQQNRVHFIENVLEIRVSPTKLDQLIIDIEALSKTLTNKRIQAKDVTEEYLDLEIRIKTKRAVISRYQDLLKQAKSVSDILAVEAELRKVIEEVESIEGRLKYLKDQVGWSTIHLTISQYFERPTNEKGFFAKLGAAFGNGWKGFLSFTVGLVTVWPFILLFIGSFYLIRQFWKGKKKAEK